MKYLTSAAILAAAAFAPAQAPDRTPAPTAVTTPTPSLPATVTPAGGRAVTGP